MTSENDHLHIYSLGPYLYCIDAQMKNKKNIELRGDLVLDSLFQEIPIISSHGKGRTELCSAL
jgi:hypothetical protein